MSLAVQFGDPKDPNALSGAVYFDAVTKYSRDYSGKVTEHPLEAGASITDHYVSNNPKFSISGIISSVDFSNIPAQLQVEGEFVLNNNKSPTPVQVRDMSGLRKFVPGVIDQFFAQPRPQITMDMDERTNFKYMIEGFLAAMMGGLYWNPRRQKVENRMTLSTIYELDTRGTPIRPISNLCVVGVSIDEDEETGDALIMNVNFERVTFVQSAKAQAPKANIPAVKRKVEPKKDKGTVPTDVKQPPKDRATVEGSINAGNAAITGR